MENVEVLRDFNAWSWNALIEKINMFKYAYAPKGFLIDYHDTNLLKEFTKAYYEMYYKIKTKLERMEKNYTLFSRTLNKEQFIEKGLLNFELPNAHPPPGDEK